MNIDRIFKNIRGTREEFINLMKGLNLNEINNIPIGFNNNIAWNFGHIIITTPALCYQRTGVDPNHSIPFQTAYAKDSKPTYQVGQEELEALYLQSITSIDQIEQDYRSGKFSKINSFSTGTYKIELTTIEEVILTTLMHDNLHYGYAIAQRKLKNS